MGKELVCIVRCAGKSSSGKALLESTEVLFRGEFRLKIPFASLKSVVAHNGELHLKWADGSAVFELDGQAEKWADKILHPKTTAEKLGIKPGLVISSIGIGDGTFLRHLRDHARSFSAKTPLKNSDLIFLGVENTSNLEGVGALAASLASAGALWIVYPKGNQHLKELHVLAAGRAAGLVDVKVTRFSDTHTALKFVRPKHGRS